MNDLDVLSKKLSSLREYLRHLEQAHDITWTKYTSDIRSKAFVERYLHQGLLGPSCNKPRLLHSSRFFDHQR